MHRVLPTVARCCFCAPLRYGLLVWAYLKLVISIIVSGMTVIFLFVSILYSYEIALVLLTVATMISLVFDIIFNFVLIVGSHKKNTTLLRLYYRYAIAHAITFVTLGLLWIVLGITYMAKPLYHPDSLAWLAAMASAVIGPLILHIYLFIVLRSEINKLKAKDQFRFVNPAAECSMPDDDAVNIMKNNVVVQN